MGNYRQHITFAAVLGVVYAWSAYVLAGLHWIYGSVAALLATLSGLLPDLDSDSGVELKGFTGILGVLAAMAAWHVLAEADPEEELPFELHLWAVIACYVFVRHGMRRIVSRLMVHRGMSHSLPTCAVWAALTYLYYPSAHHAVRLAMALAVAIGFFSHLLLDEICSVDLRGARVNRAFGTAIKLWAPSPWSTLGVYTLLAYLAWRVIQAWPPEPFAWIDDLP
ncbi:MAG: metal-dependent hydrolase, partial [Isosphaeraceae bacterium]|nr:metal-dependent hydrolase [Isosphaeraceae bacterium]